MTAAGAYLLAGVLLVPQSMAQTSGAAEGGAKAKPTEAGKAGTPIKAERGAVSIRSGENQEAARLEFSGSVGSKASIRREGQSIFIRFPTPEVPNFGRILVDPPSGITKAEVKREARYVELVLTLAEKVDPRFGREGDAVFLQLNLPKNTPEAGTQSETLNDRPNPIPATGSVPVNIKATAAETRVEFVWRAPLGAAVFRRGEVIWAVFDAEADFRLPAGFDKTGVIRSFRTTRQGGLTVVRIEAPTASRLAAVAEGSTWVLRMGGISADKDETAEVKVERDEQSGPAALTAFLAGATKVGWIKDPVVGDVFGVVTALGPSKTLGHVRAGMDYELPVTAQGLVVQKAASDVKLTIDGDRVHIFRPKGLAMSAPSVLGQGNDAVPEGLPQPATMAGVLDSTNWAKLGKAGFWARYTQLQQLAAEEGALKNPAAPTTARMALARFLMGSDLGYEALGVFDTLGRQKPAMLNDPEFRALRAVSKIMLRRYKAADTDLGSPALVTSPAAALWRGYVNSQLGSWQDALKNFKVGALAIDRFEGPWRTRLATAHARAALEAGDLTLANRVIDYAVKQSAPPLDLLAARLVQARMFEAQGDSDRALKVYEAVSRASLGAISAPATLRATKIKVDKGLITPKQAVDTLEGLKFRWRGDNTELEVVRTLADIYVSQGRYREALQTLRGSSRVNIDLPEAVKLQNDMASSFKALFLDGLADGLQPIQALALFYDYKDLTPIGDEGDEMVRRMARRLVDVDLLDQAAELLKYQVENRLQGVAKAQVATDLASIQLMNRQPEKALQALWGSRSTLLPGPMAIERRALEARALMELGRYDHALEVLGNDQGKDAMNVRADVFWRMKDWPKAASAYEKLLGDRFKGPQEAMNAEDEARLIRAGISYSLGEDDASLKRLNDRYAGLIDLSRSPELLRIALSGLTLDNVGSTDFQRAANQSDTFAGWVAEAKKRLRERTLKGQDKAPASAQSPATPAAKAPAAANRAAPSSIPPSPAAKAPAAKPAAKKA